MLIQLNAKPQRNKTHTERHGVIENCNAKTHSTQNRTKEKAITPHTAF